MRYREDFYKGPQSDYEMKQELMTILSTMTDVIERMNLILEQIYLEVRDEEKE